jgi:hypothetical protein
MGRSSGVDIGQTFAANGHGLVWRVERHLADGLHVVIAREDDPSRKKTISIWGLLDTEQYRAIVNSAKS